MRFSQFAMPTETLTIHERGSPTRLHGQLVHHDYEAIHGSLFLTLQRRQSGCPKKTIPD